MRDRLAVFVQVASVAAALFLSGPVSASAQAPDKIFFGNILTMVEDDLFAEAVAVTGDRIIGVGSIEEMRQLADDATEMIDLEGGTMLPGFIDTHGHMLGAGTREVLSVNLRPPPMGTMTKMDELVAALAERLKAVCDGAARRCCTSRTWSSRGTPRATRSTRGCSPPPRSTSCRGSAPTGRSCT